ncbi:MAG: hypothetical protein ACXAEI_14720, partial [Candidatus Hodarchaeales archaeon]
TNTFILLLISGAGLSTTTLLYNKLQVERTGAGFTDKLQFTLGLFVAVTIPLKGVAGRTKL